MSIRIKAAAALALVAMATPQAAMAQTCITEQEISGMMAYAMPSLLDGLVGTCRPHVSDTGFIATSSAAMIQAYSTRKDANWPVARAAFMKFGAKRDAQASDMMAKLPDNVLQPLVGSIMTSVVGTQIKPEQCGNAERLMRIFSKIDPQDTADLFGIVMLMVGNDNPAKRDIQICGAAASTPKE